MFPAISRALRPAVILLLAACMGCSGLVSGVRNGDTIKWHADKSFNNTDRDCFRVATDKYFEQTNGVVDMSITYDYDHNSVISRAEHVLDDKLENWYSGDLEVLQIERKSARMPDGSMITLYGATTGYLSPDQSLQERIKHQPIRIGIVTDLLDHHTCVLTTMHEMGHALALSHDSSSRGNIMYPYVYPQRTECLKSSDAKDLYETWSRTWPAMAQMPPVPCDDQPDDVFPKGGP